MPRFEQEFVNAVGIITVHHVLVLEQAQVRADSVLCCSRTLPRRPEIDAKQYPSERRTHDQTMRKADDPHIYPFFPIFEVNVVPVVWAFGTAHRLSVVTLITMDALYENITPSLVILSQG